MPLAVAVPLPVEETLSWVNALKVLAVGMVDVASTLEMDLSGLVIC